jgi:hypothetical protein
MHLLVCLLSQVIILLSAWGFTGRLFTKRTDRPLAMTMTTIELEEQGAVSTSRNLIQIWKPEKEK